MILLCFRVFKFKMNDMQGKCDEGHHARRPCVTECLPASALHELLNKVASFTFINKAIK